MIAAVVARATGRAVCLAFAAALRKFGVPGEVLTDNGKQFTDRFGKGGEVLSGPDLPGQRHRPPADPAPVADHHREDRAFHGSLRRELLDDAVPFSDLAAAQAAVDAWVAQYNTARPHQALGMAFPADRFSTARARFRRTCKTERAAQIELGKLLAMAQAGRQPA